jgi:hypothetical protein
MRPLLESGPADASDLPDIHQKPQDCSPIWLMPSARIVEVIDS